VNKGREQSFDAFWSEAVFELYNLTNCQDFERIDQEAIEGKLTKEAFITKTIESESHAADKTRSFYIHVFLPWAKEQHVPTVPASWHLGGRWGSEENPGSLNVDRSGGYWKHYEREFDSILVCSLIMRGNSKKADELTARIKEGATSDDKALLHLNRGIAYTKKGDDDRAIADFNEATHFNSMHAATYYYRGNMYVRKGEYDKAIADYNEAIRLNPEHADAYYGRGWVFGNQKEYDKAISDYSVAIGLNPKYAIAYYGRGCAYWQKGEYAKAQADFEQAKRLGYKGP